MPLQNRMTPLGETIAVSDRGLVYGNRGVLHDRDGRIRRPFDGTRWIACALHFRGRRRHPLLRPGRFTELFFVDEATALAAGHRPCAECRNADYRRFLTLFGAAHPGATSAGAVDAILHAERIDPVTRRARLQRARPASLPDGSMVLLDGAPWLVAGGWLLAWTPGGYAERRRRPARGELDAITPPSVRGVLAAGFAPLVHPSAADLVPSGTMS